MMRKDYLGIQIHEKDPEYISDFGRTLLTGHYLREGETIPEAFARAATNYCYGDYALAQRIYDYVYNNWFMYASPIASNSIKGEWKTKRGFKAKHYWYNHEFHPLEKEHGLPISCYGMYVPDNLDGQRKAMSELALLSTSGGGVGIHNGIRAISDKAPGPIPYMKVLDSIIGYYRQGKTRRGAISYYLDIDHPDIIEHTRFRVSGGDSKRRSDNRTQFHNGTNITDKFIEAFKQNKSIDLTCPHTGKVYEEVPARTLWQELIDTRSFTGEPKLCKIDLANRKMPESQKRLGLKVHGSNICSEIILPTDEERTFVCCLSSLNLERYDEWKDTTIVEDLTRFLDNVLQWFIDNAGEDIERARYSAERERALGIGAFGWHSYLQSKMIPLEGGGFNSSVQHANNIHKLIQERAIAASKQLAKERGEAPDMIGTGMRNSKLIAIAPNASSADIANSSPSIEPWYRNIFIKPTRAGTVEIKNKYLERLLESKGFNDKQTWKSIEENDGSVQHLDFLSEHEKKVFKTAMELDQHWLVELADVRGKYVCQAQSLNLFFPYGSSREYVNSVHIKWLLAENVVTLYYYRTERESKVDKAKNIERKALEDWNGTDCISCQG